jgi:hypothetical protein
MSSLRSIELPYFSSQAQLLSLVSPPHQLHRLEALSLNGVDVSPSTLEQLATNVPTLTRIEPPLMDVECLPILVKFKQLRHLQIGLSNRSQSRFSTLAPHLHAFGQLRSLRLEQFTFKRDEEVVQLMSAMPHLEELKLHKVRLPSFNGLAAAVSLTSIHISCCPGVNFDGLCQLAKCTRLTSLQLAGRHSPLTWKQVADLTPPSKLLPNLRWFIRGL